MSSCTVFEQEIKIHAKPINIFVILVNAFPKSIMHYVNGAGPPDLLIMGILDDLVISVHSCLEILFCSHLGHLALG